MIVLVFLDVVKVYRTRRHPCIPEKRASDVSIVRIATLAHPFLIVLSRAVRDSKYATFGGLETAHIE